MPDSNPYWLFERPGVHLQDTASLTLITFVGLVVKDCDLFDMNCQWLDSWDTVSVFPGASLAFISSKRTALSSSRFLLRLVWLCTVIWDLFCNPLAAFPATKVPRKCRYFGKIILMDVGRWSLQVDSVVKQSVTCSGMSLWWVWREWWLASMVRADNASDKLNTYATAQTHTTCKKNM